MKTWSVHGCARDPDCQQLGVIHRYYLHTKWGSLIIASRRDSWTQAWLPFWGYMDRLRLPVVWHPKG